MIAQSDDIGSAQVDRSVDKLFSEAEVEAEKTIGWVRIALGLALFVSGLLVASSIGAPNAGRPFQISVLITVVAFLALGLASLLLVHRGWFKSWMAFGLVSGDALIVGFSLYFGLKGGGLSGNWITAMPTIWAVPLILAVGALRYRPGVQLWATAAMMLALVGVALALSFHTFLSNLETLEFLRDIETTVGRLISLPPYLIRAVMLTLVGLMTTLVMIRSRRLLMRAVSETAHRAQLSRFLPAEITPLIGPKEIANWRDGRRQNATILFVDMRGSTAFAENMNPTELSVFISSFRQQIMHAAAAHEAVVDKFIGDGALLLFGVPNPRGDDCSRAIACALNLLALIDQWNSANKFTPPIRVGIGIHTGEVYCGLVGDDRRLEFTVLGDVVNVAAKIEHATKRFGAALLVSEAVVTSAGQRDTWQEVSREALGGRGEQLAIFVQRPKAA